MTASTRFATFAITLICLGTVARPEPAAAQADTAPRPVVSEKYVLRPGDQLAIAIPQSPKDDAIGIVASDGVLYLKGIGEVTAAGLTIPQLTEQVTKILKKRFLRPRAEITLVKEAPPLPPHKITVVGNVTQPGPRDLVEGLRIAKALELAGGTTKDAELKKVLVLRKDLTRIEVDLSTAELLSDPKQNVLLQDGDSVYVPAIPPKELLVITIIGAVGKPGAVQLEEAPRAFKAIELAGGPMKDADLSKVTITHKDATQTIVDLSTREGIASPKHNRELADGDSINVPSLYLEGQVSIDGAVVDGGTYDLKPGWKLDDLIKEAKKMTILADVEHVELRRVGAAPRVINLVQHQNGGQKVALLPGDHVFIPEYAGRITLKGGVANAGLRPLRSGQTVRQFLLSDTTDGDATNNTKIDLGKAKLVRGDDLAIEIDLKKVLKDPRDKRNVVLMSGDVLILPGKESRSPDTSKMVGVSFLNVLANLFAF